RKRPDGRFYALDFTLAEIQSLRVTERIDPKTKRPVFPNRFPPGKSVFRLAPLAEGIELIQGLNRGPGRQVGVYPQTKAPAWHRKQGKDVSRVVLDVLHRYGYRDKGDRVYVQCFDPAELRRLREEFRCRLKLVQLLAEDAWKEAPADFARL